MNRSLCAVVLLGLAPSLARAQPAPDRFELGQRLRAFELELSRQTDPKVRQKVLTGLKPITAAYFTGRSGEAARLLDQARRGLASDKAPDPAAVWADALSLRPAARLLDVTASELPFAVAAYYDPMTDRPAKVRLRVTLLDEAGGDLAAVALDVGDLPCEGKLAFKKAPPEGEYQLRTEVLVGDKVVASGAQTLSFVQRLPERLKALQEKVARFKDKPLDADRATARRLAGLLSELADKKTLETNYPAARLLAEAEAVLAAVEKDKPYYGHKRTGSFYLSLAVKDGAAPVRFLAPEQAADGKPAPLVIALHGAGGSENMFFDGYGHGEVVERCRRRGWLLVSTRYGIPDGLIDAVDALYPVDRKRVFVVGHSLGASQAMAAVSARPEAFVAAAALGGGGAVTASDALKSVPIFVGVGSEDPVARGGSLLLRDQLKKAGVKTLKFQEYDGAEHLTVVQLGLKDVFEFFDEAAKR